MVEVEKIKSQCDREHDSSQSALASHAECSNGFERYVRHIYLLSARLTEKSTHSLKQHAQSVSTKQSEISDTVMPGGTPGFGTTKRFIERTCADTLIKTAQISVLFNYTNVTRASASCNTLGNWRRSSQLACLYEHEMRAGAAYLHRETEESISCAAASGAIFFAALSGASFRVSNLVSSD